MATSSRYDNLIKKYVKEANKRPVKVDGREVKIPWQLIKAMMLQESAGKRGAESIKGALGLLQVMPRTAREMGVDPDKLKTDVKLAIRTGVRYFKKKLKQFDGDFDFAISSYNAGATNVKRGIKKYGRNYALKFTHEDDFATHEKGHKDAGQSETQAYNRRIRAFYRDLTGKDLPGESYYNAIESLGYKYDKFAANRKGAFERLDRMTPSEIIAGIGSGEIDRTDLGYIKQIAKTRGRDDFVKTLDYALNYEPNRQQQLDKMLRPDDQIVVREPTLIDTGSGGRAGKLTDHIYNPQGSEQEQYQRLLALEKYVDSLQAEPKTMVATAPSGTVEFGEPTIRRSAASTPPGVALVSPVGLAEAVTATVPQPTPVELPSFEGLPPLNMPSGSALKQYGDFTRAPAVPQPPVVAPVELPSFKGLPPLQVPSVPALQHYSQLPPAPPAPRAPTNVAMPPMPVIDPLVKPDLLQQPVPRTAPAVRSPEPVMANKSRKRKLSPAEAAVEAARVKNTAVGTAKLPGIPAPPQLASVADQNKRTRQSVAYQLLAQEYNANLPGAPLSGEEEFLRDAAQAQLLQDLNQREIGFVEAFGGGLMGRDLVKEQQDRNQGALEKYRKSVGLGDGQSRRRMRAELASKISEVEGRAARALENEFLAKRQEYGAKLTEVEQKRKAKLDSEARAVEIDLKHADVILKQIELWHKGEQRKLDLWEIDARLLNTLLPQGLDKKSKQTIAAAGKKGGANFAPYVKELFKSLASNSDKSVDLVRKTSMAQFMQSQKQGKESIQDYQRQYFQLLRLMTGSLKGATQLAALNMGTAGYAITQQAEGLLAGTVKPEILEKALKGELEHKRDKNGNLIPVRFSLKKNGLADPANFTARVGKNNLSNGIRNLEAQLRFLNIMSRHKSLLAKSGVDAAAAAAAARRTAINMGGPESVQLVQLLDSQNRRAGLMYNEKTNTYEQVVEDKGDPKAKVRADALKDALLRRNFPRMMRPILDREQAQDYMGDADE